MQNVCSLYVCVCLFVSNSFMIKMLSPIFNFLGAVVCYTLVSRSVQELEGIAYMPLGFLGGFF